MRSIAKLFGRSPFVALQAHMDKVAECVDKAREVLEAFQRGDHDAIAELSREISRREHEADQVKYDIQSHLPRGLFMPIDRERLLEILAVQDSIADTAENMGVLLTLKQVSVLEPLREDLAELITHNLEAFDCVRQVIGQLDELLETGFGGGEAEKVLKMIDEVSLQEHEADVLQRSLLKKLFANEDQLSMGDFILWSKLLSELSGISNRSERLANRVRRTLELKR